MVKKHKTKVVSRRLLYAIVGVQTVMFAIIAIVLFAFTSVRTQTWNLPSTEMVYLLGSSISGLSREASITPDNTYQYIPEAKLRFKTVNNQKIVYFYNQEDEESSIKSSIVISSDAIKRNSIAELYQYNHNSIPKGQQLFDRVPGVQNCNKIFVLSYDDNIGSYHGQEYSLIKTINIGGESLYIWKHNGNLCNAAKNTELVNNLEQMLLGVENY